MKGVGYSISTISVVLLGAVAKPGPNEPSWKIAVLIVGMTLSSVGMVVRYFSHRKDKHQLDLRLRQISPDGQGLPHG